MARIAPVQGLPVSPPPLSLLAAAASPVDDPGTRWERGFEWRPEACGSWGYFEACDGGALTVHDGPALRRFVPYGIYSDEKCNAMEITADWEGRARRQLLAATPKAVENEFWTGAKVQAHNLVPGQTDPWTNDYLANSPTDLTSGTGEDPDVALACLEDALGDGAFGSKGMIHATRKTVTMWSKLGMVRREGNSIYTINDTIVVSGVGYPGTGPDGLPFATGHWAYASDMVTMRLSDIAIPTNPNDRSQSMDRNLDTIVVRATRLAAATFDGCRKYAIKVTLPSCADVN